MPVVAGPVAVKVHGGLWFGVIVTGCPLYEQPLQDEVPTVHTRVDVDARVYDDTQSDIGTSDHLVGAVMDGEGHST